MNTDTIAKKFWEDGYVCLEGFFDNAVMDQYNNTILDYFAQHPDFVHTNEFLQKSATEVIAWFPQEEGCNVFEKIENDTRLMALSTAILGNSWQPLHTMVMFSPKGTKGQAWHQDCPPENPHQFNVNRLVYTHNIDKATGGEIVVLPKTHRLGEISAGELDEYFPDQVELSPSKGSLIMLHGHTWHRVRPVTDHYRVSTNYRALPKDTPSDITDVCVYRNMRYEFSTQRVLVERTAS